MKKILAVSGGIDSMVLFDTMKNDPDVVVAHFNHGTRLSANDDQKFVAKIAKENHVPFSTEKANLGADVSEEQARTARYEFLNRVAREQGGKIYTAHHVDDLLESIAINILRGTGWRGLAPLDNPEIMRPLLNWSKNDIYKYAAEHRIVFRQDPTNYEDKYLRNRLRPLIKNLPEETKNELENSFERQRKIKNELENSLNELLPNENVYKRNLFIVLPEEVATELLKMALSRAGISTTRPQLNDFLDAIRTYAPEKSFNLPGDRLVKLHKTYFTL